MNEIIIICGPTGSGKSAIANEIAYLINAEIINADSMQIYHDLPILTASPLPEITTKLPHHLYNFLPLNASYDLTKYIKSTAKVTEDLIARKKQVIIVGGTGMYINSIIEGYSKIPLVNSDNQNKARKLQQNLGQKNFYQLALTKDPEIKKIHANDSQRTCRAVEVFFQTGKSIYSFKGNRTVNPFKKYVKKVIYLNPEREFLRNICKIRLIDMFNNKVIFEVEKAMAKYGNDLRCKIIGFREISNYITGTIDYKHVMKLVEQKTLQYAKRQRTWFNHQLKVKEEYNFSSYDEFNQVKNKLLSQV